LNNQISNDIKRTVIRLYLQGKSRNDIARSCGLGEGTVSNIVEEWKHRLGYPYAESLRELAINLKRLGIDAAECAEGFRIWMSIKRLGVNENQFESFIREVNEYCQRYGLTAGNAASNLLALIKLLKDIPFAKIPEYIEKKKNEKIILEEDIRILKDEKETLESERSTAKDLRDAALENEKTTVAELREYRNFKTELRRYGLLSSSILDDTRKIVQVIYGLKQRGYDVDKVLSEYSDLEFKQVKRDIFSNQVRTLEDKIVDLRYECSFLEYQVNLHSQKLYAVDELKSMGIGLRELKIILNAIKEIAVENGIIYSLAVERFFEFLERQYDIKLRLKKSRITTTTTVTADISENIDRDSNLTTNNYPSNQSYYFPVSLSEQRSKQQQEQTPSPISSKDNSNNNIVSATETGLIEKGTCGLDFTNLEIKANDNNIKNRAVDKVDRTIRLIPDDIIDIDKLTIDATKLLGYSNEINTTTFTEKQNT